MARWSDKSHEDRQPEDRRPVFGPETTHDSHRGNASQRRVEHEPHRWRRGDRPTTAAEWEVAQYYDSFFDVPRA